MQSARTFTAVFDGITVDAVRAACGWPLRVADRLAKTAPPTEIELRTLRALQERTRAAHSRRVRVTLNR